MSQAYEIKELKHWKIFVDKIEWYFKKRQNDGMEFQPLSIVVKRWRKPKTSKQHRLYFALIGKLTELYRDAGYDINVEDMHALVKLKANFVKIIDTKIIPKSISDASDEATSKALNELIEFVLRHAMQDFGVNLKEGYE